MDAYERKAAFAEARAEAYEVSLARHSVSSKPESSNNSNSDTQHRKLTDAEGSRWQRYIDGQINAAISAAMAEHFVARISSRAKSAPRIHIHVRRT